MNHKEKQIALLAMVAMGLFAVSETLKIGGVFEFVDEPDPDPTTTPPSPPNETWAVCSSHSDCIKVSDDCCGCGGGGKATSINKDFLSLLNAYHVAECSGIMCATVMSDDPTCVLYEPHCVAQTCVLMDPACNLGLMGCEYGEKIVGWDTGCPIRECKTADEADKEVKLLPDPVCGNYICDPGENCVTCHQDCMVPPTGVQCGSTAYHVCDPTDPDASPDGWVVKYSNPDDVWPINERVCGSDGKTYYTDCFAEMAGVTWVPGPCLDSPDPIPDLDNESDTDTESPSPMEEKEWHVQSTLILPYKNWEVLAAIAVIILIVFKRKPIMRWLKKQSK
jgi:hypothetical protein